MSRSAELKHELAAEVARNPFITNHDTAEYIATMVVANRSQEYVAKHLDDIIGVEKSREFTTWLWRELPSRFSLPAPLDEAKCTPSPPAADVLSDSAKKTNDPKPNRIQRVCSTVTIPRRRIPQSAREGRSVNHRPEGPSSTDALVFGRSGRRRSKGSSNDVQSDTEVETKRSAYREPRAETHPDGNDSDGMETIPYDLLQTEDEMDLTSSGRHDNDTMSGTRRIRGRGGHGSHFDDEDGNNVVDAIDDILNGTSSERDVRFTITMNSHSSVGKRKRELPRSRHHLHNGHHMKSVAGVENGDPAVEEDGGNGADGKRTRRRLRRCQFWPMCKNGTACPFHHPVDTCRHFPNCPFGSECHYIHPTALCKFGLKCSNPDCTFSHPTTSVPPARDKAPCKFGYSCQRRQSKSCNFAHPLSACKFGDGCWRGASCTFSHAPKCRHGNTCNTPMCAFGHVDTAHIADRLFCATDG